jgi:hypothetical protein
MTWKEFKRHNRFALAGQISQPRREARWIGSNGVYKPAMSIHFKER